MGGGLPRKTFSMTLMTLRSDNITLGETPFALPWLRFSCPCEACRHPASFQRIADLSLHTQELPEEAAASLSPDGRLLRVTWREKPAHHSTYRVDWLLDHAWNRAGKEEFGKETLWDASAPVVQNLRWHRASDCRAGLGT